MSQYPVTLPDAVLDEVRHAATEEHTSVDELLGALIVNGLEQRQGAKMMAKRARRADPCGSGPPPRRRGLRRARRDRPRRPTPGTMAACPT